MRMKQFIHLKMRFSEALALTPKDFDFAHQTLSISKTWDYKGDGGFQPTKTGHLDEKYRLIGRLSFSFLNW